MNHEKLKQLHECSNNIYELMCRAKTRIKTREDLAKWDLFPSVAEHWENKANDTRRAYERLKRSYISVQKEIVKLCEA